MQKNLCLWGKYMCCFRSKALYPLSCSIQTVLRQNVKVMIAGNQLWIWCITTNTGHERYHKNVLILNQIRVMILKLLLNNNSVKIMKMEIQETNWKYLIWKEWLMEMSECIVERRSFHWKSFNKNFYISTSKILWIPPIHAGFKLMVTETWIVIHFDDFEVDFFLIFVNFTN